MNKEVIKAIEGSIAKWDLIAQGIGINQGGYNCPLCKMFSDLNYENLGVCDNCPVYLKTGFIQCFRTPYYDFVDATWGPFDTRTLPEMENEVGPVCDACEREIEFLIGLLPEKARRKYKL